MERLTDKLVVNNKFIGYCAKSNMQHRISNRNETNDITNTTEIIDKFGQLEDMFEIYNIESMEEFELCLAKYSKNKLFKIKENGCENYLIDKKGNIFSRETRKFLKQYANKQGYMYVMIKGKQYLIHRLVAKTFIENPNNYFEVNHKNENKSDNRVNNLEWCNRKYNATYKNCHLRHNEWNKKPIDQYNLQGDYIKTWSYALEAEKAGVGKASSIKQCCRNKLAIHNGFVWRWHSETFESRRTRKVYDRSKNFHN